MKRTKTFVSTMSEITTSMPLVQRIFSKILHNQLLSVVVDILTLTVVRPNALLFGAIASFVATLFTYVIAKNLGYELSGFEPIGGFMIGWAIGIVIDLLILLLPRKH